MKTVFNTFFFIFTLENVSVSNLLWLLLNIKASVECTLGVCFTDRSFLSSYSNNNIQTIKSVYLYWS